MEQMNQLPPSPHHVHPLNPPPPPGSMAEYPPSPGYPPPGHPRSGLPSPAHPPQEYGEMMNGQYGPPANYPPPPALGYTHQLVRTDLPLVRSLADPSRRSPTRTVRLTRSTRTLTRNTKARPLPLPASLANSHHRSLPCTLPTTLRPLARCKIRTATLATLPLLPPAKTCT
ncbi:hypothetical protein BJY59DRAFT_236433 [Rhodotorula toruloides]